MHYTFIHVAFFTPSETRYYRYHYILIFFHPPLCYTFCCYYSVKGVSYMQTFKLLSFFLYTHIPIHFFAHLNSLSFTSTQQPLGERQGKNVNWHPVSDAADESTAKREKSEWSKSTGIPKAVTIHQTWYDDTTNLSSATHKCYKIPLHYTRSSITHSMYAVIFLGEAFCSLSADKTNY